MVQQVSWYFWSHQACKKSVCLSRLAISTHRRPPNGVLLGIRLNRKLSLTHLSCEHYLRRSVEFCSTRKSLYGIGSFVRGLPFMRELTRDHALFQGIYWKPVTNLQRFDRLGEGKGQTPLNAGFCHWQLMKFEEHKRRSKIAVSWARLTCPSMLMACLNRRLSGTLRFILNTLDFVLKFNMLLELWISNARGARS